MTPAELQWSEWAPLDDPDLWRGVPQKPGVYRIGLKFGLDAVRLVYIGESRDLQRRVPGYLNHIPKPGEHPGRNIAERPLLFALGYVHRRFWYVSWAECADHETMEASLLLEHTGLLNAERGPTDEERALTLAEEVEEQAAAAEWELGH